jgi:hypothetical protein
MVLLRGMCHPDPQYLVASIREAKCTLWTPPLALAFSRSSHSATANSEQENNQETPDKLHVPQVDPPVIGLHNSN